MGKVQVFLSPQSVNACCSVCVPGSVLTCGNVLYVIMFGWWISLTYLLLCPLMFLTICGAPYGVSVFVCVVCLCE